jgi:hypothetical protein
MIAIRNAGRRRMVVCAVLALIAAFSVMACGCGNPGEGTVHVDPRVAAKLGKYRGVPPASYGKTKVESIGTKSRRRNDPAPK